MQRQRVIRCRGVLALGLDQAEAGTWLAMERASERASGVRSNSDRCEQRAYVIGHRRLV